MDGGTPRNIILWFFLALFGVSCLLLGWLLRPFISILVLASVVTGVFRPLYLRGARRLPPFCASALTCLVIFVVLFVPIAMFIGVLSKEAYDMYLTAKGAVLGETLHAMIENSRVLERANAFLANFQIRITGEELNRAVSELAKAVSLFIFEQARGVASNMLKFVVNFFFMLLVTFYLLIDGERLLAFIKNLSPLPEEQDEKLVQKFKDMAGAVLVVNGLGGIIQGTLGGVVLGVFGFRSPILWGVILGLLAFLPIVGIGAVFLPAAGYLVLKGRYLAALFFLAFYIVLSFGTEYFFKPKLVGSRVQMHTLLVFLSIIGGLQLFGIIGIVYGPLVLTAFLTLTDIYHRSYQQLVEDDKP